VRMVEKKAARAKAAGTAAPTASDAKPAE